MTKRQFPTDPLDRALLGAVLAAPADDAPRLVYADRLLSRDDQRGELIIVQCTCARLEREGGVDSDEYKATKLREAALLEQIERPWFDEFGAYEYWKWRLTRGFFTHVVLSRQLLHLRWRLFAAHPLESVLLTYSNGDDFMQGLTLGELAWMARKPVLQRTQTLTFSCVNGMVDLEPDKMRAAFREVAVDDGRRSWPMHGEPALELIRAARAPRRPRRRPTARTSPSPP